MISITIDAIASILRVTFIVPILAGLAFAIRFGKQGKTYRRYRFWFAFTLLLFEFILLNAAFGRYQDIYSTYKMNKLDYKYQNMTAKEWSMILDEPIASGEEATQTLLPITPGGPYVKQVGDTIRYRTGTSDLAGNVCDGRAWFVRKESDKSPRTIVIETEWYKGVRRPCLWIFYLEREDKISQEWWDHGFRDDE